MGNKELSSVNHDDDLSKTMLIPNPGGRRTSAPSIAPNTSLDATQVYHSPERSMPNEPAILHSDNEILSSASDIISLAANLQTLSPNGSVEQLRIEVERLFNELNDTLRQRGIANEIALTARYLLCCLVDELVLNTPWGAQGYWSQQTLLSKFHNETSGGEKCFLIIDKVLQQPNSNTDLLELSYVCLSLGFKGKYRITSNGENELLHICQRLSQAIAIQRPETKMLSPDGESEKGKIQAAHTRFPLNLFFFVLLFVCSALYAVYLSNLHTRSTPIFQMLETIAANDLPSLGKSETTYNAKVILDQLSIQLAEHIGRGQIELAQSNGLVSIRLISPALFPPGRTTINQQALPAVTTLNNVILAHSDSVLIVGHTDSTGQAESNWVISRQRADAVQAWLLSSEPSVKYSDTQGLADTQPLVNTTSASENRRVEIILLPREGR
jgi:type VI secretion system protein ImpK